MTNQQYSKRYRWLVLIVIPLFLALIGITPAVSNAQKSAMSPIEAAKQKLLGKHLFSLQWISWDYFGTVNVTDNEGVLQIKGEQHSKENDDYINIDGIVTEITVNEFKFTGTIITKVSYLNSGEPCKRIGIMTFAIRGNRKYWRLQEMDNPCDSEGVVDYIDIFLR